MINEERTKEDFGYISDDLTPGAMKHIWAICNDCGNERSIRYKNYIRSNGRCKSCSNSNPSDEKRRKLSERQIGIKNHNYGKTASKETRRKMSENSPRLSGANHPMYGIQHSKKTCAQMSASRVGKHHSEETKLKISKFMSGPNNPLLGKHPTEETIRKISESTSGEKHPNYGTHRTDETKKRISATLLKQTYDEWESYAVNSPYCPKFNNACKESNRDKYNRLCFICGLPENDNITSTGKHKKLSVHHVDMNKQQGCEGHEWKLIPVCVCCHGGLHSDVMMSRIEYILSGDV